MTGHNSQESGLPVGSSPGQHHDDNQEIDGRRPSGAHQAEAKDNMVSSVTKSTNDHSTSLPPLRAMPLNNELSEGHEEDIEPVHKAGVYSEEADQDSDYLSDRPDDLYNMAIFAGSAIGKLGTTSQATSTVTTSTPSEVFVPMRAVPPKQRFSSLKKSLRAQDNRFSLRRALLAGNIENPPEPLSSLAEPSLAGSSARERTHPLLTSTTTTSKGSGTTVTASPIVRFDEDPEPAFGQSKNGRKQVSNLRQTSKAQQRSFSAIISEEMKNTYQRTYKFLNRINEIPPSIDGRHIELDVEQQKPLKDERTGKAYMNNEIRSNKYSLWNFLPRQLFAQFSKLANFYFLCISVLQLIPGLSTTGSYTTIVPLLFFVGISMAKEAYEDLRRHRLDKVDNNRMTDVLQNQSRSRSSGHDGEHSTYGNDSEAWISTKWQDIQVGDIIRLRRNEAVPADLVILQVKGANDTAYVETMALDGETNLKSKTALPIFSTSDRPIDSLLHCKAKVVVEDPNLDLYTFQGRVTIDEETLPLTNNEILYRGSILRNTSEVIGMTVYSGQESKIRMNATKNPRIKAPALQAAVNRVVFMIVLFVLALAICNTAAYQIWKSTTERKAFYLSNASVSFITILISFIILFNTMIPLSLYVSLEIIKAFQLLLMNDIEMYDKVSNTPMEPRTSTINEDLGQISHIFSDKTGTLTNNVMLFRRMSVAGSAWWHDVNPREATVEATATSFGHPLEGRSTTELLEYLRINPNTDFVEDVRIFLLSIALCHTCIPEVKEDGSIDFQAASPDELALVNAAKALGYLLVENHSGNITIKISLSDRDSEPTFEKYKVLQIIEFSSKRKRMSTLIRMPDNRIYIFCKGADSTLMQRLRLSSIATEKALKVQNRANFRKSMEAQEAIRRKSEHQNRMDNMTRSSMNIGRQSLGGISRPSSTAKSLESVEDELTTWLQYQEPRSSSEVGDPQKPPPSSTISPVRQSDDQSNGARTSNNLSDYIYISDEEAVVERCFQHIDDFARDGLRTLLYGYRYVEEEEYEQWKILFDEASTSLLDRQDKIENTAELIECQFELAGATAIEDKLQDGVPSTIDQLRRANIRIWMLTGDKRETAINVGRSCRLIQDYSMITVLDHEIGDVEHRITATAKLLGREKVAHSVIVIDGHTLSIIETQDELYSNFISLTVLVDSVICCRASPSQKASLVRSIRTKVGSATTLAIGDGANDIAMIQEAHVGIGITGKEGLQAARTSDYSIAQFRFLSRLLLVHGRWNYIRTCKYTLGTFWKEMLFYLTQALYQRYTGYTGTSLYESWSLSLFNTLFTSLPVIFMGIFEKDLKAETLLAVPELYTFGQRNQGFSVTIYLGWVFLASSEGMIVFFLMLGLFGQALFTIDNSIFGMGAMTFSAVVIIIAVKMQFIELHYKTVTSAIALALSIGGWFAWNLVLSAIYKNNTIYDVKDGFLDRWGRNALWWLTFILVFVSVGVFEIAVKYLTILYKPSDVDIFQALERDPVCWSRICEAAANGKRKGNILGAMDRGRTAEEQAKREGEIQTLLDRPRVMDQDRSASEGGGGSGLRRRHSINEVVDVAIELDVLDT